MKVALVHDWLIHMRGGEKVLESLAEIYPEATIYTLFANRARLSPSLQRMKIKTSFLQHLPGIRIYYRWLLPALPFVIRTLKIKEADLVISSSHCVAKGIQIPPGARHICYCHTPMRYLWGFGEVYFGGFPKWLQAVLSPIFDWLRQWDVASSRQVHHFICNSNGVKERIRSIYQQEAVVVYPPVDLESFSRDGEGKRNYYLVVSALTPYKRTDLAVQAFNGWGRELVIVGDGPSRRACEKLRKTENIRFFGTVTGEELKKLYGGAKALIFPQEEDFGIVPLEAQACGTPVIAYGKGGALESVKEGVFFKEQSAEALRQAIVEFESKKINPEILVKQAQEFDKPRFKTKIKQVIENALN